MPYGKKWSAAISRAAVAPYAAVHIAVMRSTDAQPAATVRRRARRPGRPTLWVVGPVAVKEEVEIRGGGQGRAHHRQSVAGARAPRR